MKQQTRSIIGAIVATLVIVSIQFALPDSMTIGPVWLIPVIELFGIPIAIMMAFSRNGESRVFRGVVYAFLTVLVTATVMNAAFLLINLLLGASESGVFLLLAGFGVLINNVLSFGLVYWWIDAGGPIARQTEQGNPPDFLFPQQDMENEKGWKPTLIDYMYTAYTNIIAFSPTDTMPLTHRVKVFFTIQSSTAVLTILVTLSRAINLIPDQTFGS